MSQELRMWIFIVEDTLGGAGQKKCCIERERYEEAYQSLESEFDLEEQWELVQMVSYDLPSRSDLTNTLRSD